MKLVRINENSSILNESSNHDINKALKYVAENDCSDETCNLVKSAVDLLNSLSNKDIWYKAWWMTDAPYGHRNYYGVILGLSSKNYDLEFERDDRDIHCSMHLYIDLEINDNNKNKFTIYIEPYNPNFDHYSRNYEYANGKDRLDQAEQIGRHILYPLSKSLKGSSRVLSAAPGDTAGSMKIILDHVPTRSDIARVVSSFKDLMVD